MCGERWCSVRGGSCRPDPSAGDASRDSDSSRCSGTGRSFFLGGWRAACALLGRGDSLAVIRCVLGGGTNLGPEDDQSKGSLMKAYSKTMSSKSPRISSADMGAEHRAHYLAAIIHTYTIHTPT